MREQYAPLCRRPGEHVWVGGTLKSNVLNADDIKVGRATQKAADDAPIEVLVREEAKHEIPLRLLTGSETSSKPLHVGTSLRPLSQILGFIATLLEIRIHGLTVGTDVPDA